MNRYGLSDQDLDKVYGIFEVTSYERHKSGFGHVPRNEFGFLKDIFMKFFFIYVKKVWTLIFSTLKRLVIYRILTHLLSIW